MSGFDDPNDKGNSASHHTGKPCIERGCTSPAGTAWSPFWCFQHNVERIRRINKQFADAGVRLSLRETAGDGAR